MARRKLANPSHSIGQAKTLENWLGWGVGALV